MNKTTAVSRISLIFACIVFCVSGGQAQVLPISWSSSSNSNIASGIDSYGTFYSAAPYNLTASALTFTATESVTNSPLFLWIPAWDYLRIGPQAQAVNAAQPISDSFGIGYNSNANDDSVAIGYEAEASGYGSVAIGNSVSAGGPESVALGVANNAGGEASISMGLATSATGLFSSTLGGFLNVASGSYSTAVGNSTIANGTNALSAGISTTANSFDSFVIGTYNSGTNEQAGIPNLTAWNATAGSADPLFEVGNGNSSAKSDALVVYKDGNAVIQGVTTSSGGFVTTPASVANTDIPMYSGN